MKAFKKLTHVLVVVLLGSALAAPAVAGDGKTSLSAGLAVADGHKDFHLAVRTHYGVSDKALGAARKKKIKDDELPVLFHLCARAKVEPGVVIGLRTKGKSWSEITLHLGLGADIYYVPLEGRVGPPYGKAHGHFKKRPRNQWHEIVLTDGEIVDLVSLRFMSEHHGFSPNEVVKLRGKHKDCFSFHVSLKNEKEKRRAAGKASGKPAGKGKGGDGGSRGKKPGPKRKSGKKGKG